MFSVPINPKLSEKEFGEFYNFILDYKDWIYDLYFTCRMPPFMQDAMGDVFASEEDIFTPINVALDIQNATGIKVSAVFNNIYVRPSQQNLDLFIENFRQLYDAGVRSVTIPHTHWVATGQLQKEFPDLFIKNTILRNVTEPREVAALAEAGFHYINLDRDLMRDHEKLLKIKKAKERYGVKISILANEGCLGGCSMMDEHYHFNNTRTGESPQYFNDPISRVSCKKWDFQDPAVYLKTANLPPWKEDWDEMYSDLGIDVIKMHGRESKSRLRETMDIIKRYANNQEILFDGFGDFIEETNLKDKPINVWRNKIKNCKFECWDCGFCNKIYDVKYGKQVNDKVVFVTQELVDSVNKNVEIDVPGFTSQRVINLLNALGKGSSNYLEIGSYLGSTACAVAKNNTLSITCIDNWSEINLKPKENQVEIPEATKDKFFENITRYISNKTKLNVIDSDFSKVDISNISNIDFFFYDGPKEPEAVSYAVQKFAPTFAKNAILAFDDANWYNVVQGANDGIAKSNLNVIYSKKMLNEIESERDFWNGIYIVVIDK